MKNANNKGISLISLVVTIIVLLILAGVSINLLLSDDGIISKAQEAKTKTELAIEEENEKLSMLYTMISNPTEYETSEIVSEAENVINEMQTEISTLQEEKSTLQEEITNKNTQIANLNTQITSLQNQLSVTTAENTEERARLSAQISTLQNEVSNVQSQIATKNTQIADLNTQINNKQTIITTLQTELNDINTVLGELTVESNKMLKDYTAYVNGQLVVGTMPNIGSVSQTLNAGQSYTIPEGYHDGTGVITAASLSSQTQATATADDISQGKTAWVNGEMITGTATISGEGSMIKCLYESHGSGGGTTTQTYKYTLTQSDIDTYDYFIVGGAPTGNVANFGGTQLMSKTFNVDSKTYVIPVENCTVGTQFKCSGAYYYLGLFVIGVKL